MVKEQAKRIGKQNRVKTVVIGVIKGPKSEKTVVYKGQPKREKTVEPVTVSKPLRKKTVLVTESVGPKREKTIMYHDIIDEKYPVISENFAHRPTSLRVAILNYHNSIHGEMLAEQTRYDFIQLDVNKMKEYDVLVFLAPFNLKGIKKLYELKNIKPGIKIITWWVGTDVLNAVGIKHHRDVILGISDTHVCVSEGLKDELKGIGIDAEIITLIPRVDKYKPCPLPKEYTVAIYMSSSRAEFYGLSKVMEIMKRTPDTKYLLYGNKEQIRDIPPNATDLGWVDNTTSVIKKSSCLLRLTNHDGYPQSVIEAILMGRYVICSHSYPEVDHIDDVDDIVRCLKKRPKLKKKSIKRYNELFNYHTINEKLSKIIESSNVIVPHRFGIDNGVATHIFTFRKYSRYYTPNALWKIINPQAGGSHPEADVYTAHSYYTIEDYGRFGCNPAIIESGLRAKRVIAVSNYVKNFLLEGGVPDKKIRVIGNPLDINEIDSIVINNNSDNFSLFVGSKKVKRPELFIELAKRFPEDKFVYVGKIKQLPPNVIKFGDMKRIDLLKLVKSCKTYLCLSKRESCPYMLLESMAMKKVCIASNYAGQSEIVKDGVNGFLFEPDDIESLCKAYSRSRFLNKNVRKNARVTIEKNFDARLQVPKMDNVYIPPLVSVITFVYCDKKNGRLEQLKECIDSVASQGFKSYEHIIVDDGSTIPLHKEILKMNDPHILYYHKDRTGITDSTETFNYGLRVANGKYFMFLASDDLHMNDTLSIMSCHIEGFDESVAGVVGNYMQGGTRRLQPIDQNVSETLLHRNCVNGCAIIFRRSVVDNIQLPPDASGFASDYDLWLRISEKGKIIRVRDVVVNYRSFSDSTRHKTAKDMDYRNAKIKFVVDSAKRRRGML